MENPIAFLLCVAAVFGVVKFIIAINRHWASLTPEEREETERDLREW
jgi:hypothetical protein